MHISRARLAIVCHFSFISDPLIVSKFHNETHDPKGHENKIYIIVKGRETFNRRHTVPVKVKVIGEVRKMTKIRNRYNQAPHLTQDTNGKVTTSQLDITNENRNGTRHSAIPRYIHTPKNIEDMHHTQCQFYKLGQRSRSRSQ